MGNGNISRGELGWLQRQATLLHFAPNSNDGRTTRSSLRHANNASDAINVMTNSTLQGAYEDYSSEIEDYSSEIEDYSSEIEDYNEIEDHDIESEDDYQPSEQYAPDGYTDNDRPEDRWPEKVLGKDLLAELGRWSRRFEPFHKSLRRHTQEYREWLYGTPSVEHTLVVWIHIKATERHLWLPSAFDHPRGRPYQIICERVWNSWDRYQEESDERAIRTVETDSANLTAETMRFPQVRVRHKPVGGQM